MALIQLSHMLPRRGICCALVSRSSSSSSSTQANNSAQPPVEKNSSPSSKKQNVSTSSPSKGIFQLSFHNRNPRNLERLTIAYKPMGYHLDKPGREFWHKLILVESYKYISARVVHNTGVTVVTASTNEIGFQKYLYRGKDQCAFKTLGQVMAQRCLECGIEHLSYDKIAVEGTKMHTLLKELENGGLSLKEPERYINPGPWDKNKPQKPWEVVE